MSAHLPVAGSGSVTLHRQEARRLIMQGAGVLLLGVLPIALWSATAPLAEAVVAPGVVRSELQHRPVQHAEGGTVREVRVREGQRVAQGETLMVLGDVSVEADWQRWTARIQAEQASQMRQEAEQALADHITFSPELRQAAQADPALAGLLDKETALFTLRRQTLERQLGLLRTQRQQILQEQQALQQQIARAGEALNLHHEEARNHRSLQTDGFVSASRVHQIDTQVADQAVRLEERRSELARARQKLIELDLRVQALSSDHQHQARTELKATQARLTELYQEQRRSDDARRRQVLTAPIAGEVLELKVNTPGRVLAPRETVALIVSEEHSLLVEAMLHPDDIHRVHRDQPARVRLPSLAPQTTRLFDGTLTYVAADRSTHPQTGASYYLAQIRLEAQALTHERPLRLQAGMAAEVFLQGSHRTVLDYLVEPIQHALQRAGREP